MPGKSKHHRQHMHSCIYNSKQNRTRHSAICTAALQLTKFSPLSTHNQQPGGIFTSWYFHLCWQIPIPSSHTFPNPAQAGDDDTRAGRDKWKWKWLTMPLETLPWVTLARVESERTWWLRVTLAWVTYQKEGNKEVVSNYLNTMHMGFNY